MVALDGARCARALGSACVGPAALDGDELAEGRLARPGFEAHHEPDLECLCQAFQRCDARAMLPGLDSRDRGVARAHSVGELLLGELELAPSHDHEPSDSFVWSKTLLRRPVVGVTISPTTGSVSHGGTDWAHGARAHVEYLTNIDK